MLREVRKLDSCAERICKALRIRNMKQVDLSEKTGIPKSAISQYCSGAFKPKQHRLFLIANALDVDEAWLMGLDVPMEREPQEKPKHNILRIAARDGTYIEKHLSDEDMAAVRVLIDRLPDASEDL